MGKDAHHGPTYPWDHVQEQRRVNQLERSAHLIHDFEGQTGLFEEMPQPMVRIPVVVARPPVNMPVLRDSDYDNPSRLQYAGQLLDCPPGRVKVFEDLCQDYSLHGVAPQPNSVSVAHDACMGAGDDVEVEIEI